jgi:hypothetical protein
VKAFPLSVFNRKSQPAAEPTPVKEGGKGRPTPTRKEAEAARKAAAKKPVTRRDQAAARASSSAKMREAMKTGDERYLPARDKGPVKRFVRDYVDSKFTVAELVIPLLIVDMIPGFIGMGTAVIGAANITMTLVLVGAALNLAIVRWRCLKEVRRRFPDESTRGLTSYVLLRGLQLRFLRMPKPQVKIGAQV